MKLKWDRFGGIAPRFAPSRLPEGMAQKARNCRLLSGDLETWKGLGTEQVLPRAGARNTIFKLRAPTASDSDVWLEWIDSDLGNAADGSTMSNVDVALSPVVDDLTGRFYFTGTDVPRVSNYDLATNPVYQAASGRPVGSYPYRSLPLGVPAPAAAPTVATSTADLTLLSSGSSLTGWTTSVDQASPARHVTVDNTFGNPLPSIKLENGGASAAYLQRDGSIANPGTSILQFDVYPQNVVPGVTLGFGCDSAGAGPCISFQLGGVSFGTQSAWDGGVTLTAAKGYESGEAFLSAALWYTVRLTIDVDAAVGGVRVQMFRYNSGVESTVFDGTFDFTATGDTYIGFHTASNTVWIDNIYTGQFATLTAEDVTWVYTYVNSLGEESIPSDPTAHFDFYGLTARVSGMVPPLPPNNYDIVGMRLYRSVTGTSGISYQLAADEDDLPVKTITDLVSVGTSNLTSASQPFEATDVGATLYLVDGSSLGVVTAFLSAGQVTVDTTPAAGTYTVTLGRSYFDDDIAAEDLSSVLESEDWDVPPSTLQGLLMLPNGIAAGFSGRTLYLSAQNRPHAWPVGNSLTTDTEIVGIGAVDSTVVVLTRSHAYLAYGNTPDAFAMSKLPLPQGCASKRSITYMRDLGVVYASPDGLCGIAGPGAHVNLTEKMFSRKDWQALDPASFIGIAHDERVLLSAPERDAVLIDFGAQFATKLSFHLTSVFVDTSADRLYFTLDELSQVQAVSNPLLPTLDNTIFEWDADADTYKLNAVWRGPKHKITPTAFNVAKVKADDYSNIRLRLYADGVNIFGGTITSEREFVIPATVGATYEMEIAYGGGSHPTSVQIAESAQELE